MHPLVDSSRYGLLSEVGVHILPSVSPQTYNQHGRPTLGAKFQYEGTLNELAFVVAESAGCVSTMPYIGDRSETLRVEAKILLNTVGNLDLKVVRESHGASRGTVATAPRRWRISC